MPDIYEDVEVKFVDEDASVSVSSHVLGLASPVFRAMMASGMSEHQEKRIKISADIGTKNQFAEFYRFLVPVIGRKKNFDEGNVDGVLAFSDYYQVSDLKEACEEFLISGLPASVDRLIQAERHGLTRQRLRCVEDLAKRTDVDVSTLEAHPRLLLDVPRAMQERMVEFLKDMRKRIEVTRDEIYYLIPQSVFRDGQRVDALVKAKMQSVLNAFPV